MKSPVTSAVIAGLSSLSQSENNMRSVNGISVVLVSNRINTHQRQFAYNQGQNKSSTSWPGRAAANYWISPPKITHYWVCFSARNAIAVREWIWPWPLDEKMLNGQMTKVICMPRILKVGHGAWFDWTVLPNLHSSESTRCDTMPALVIAHHSLYSKQQPWRLKSSRVNRVGHPGFVAGG